MQSNKISLDTSIYLLNRLSIYSSGRVGSLYDAYQDRLIEQMNVIDQEKLYQSHKLVRCKIIHANNDTNQNLLRLINIDEQLRLSILLKLVSDKGISSIIDYPYPTNKYTRLLCYSYVNRIQRLPERIEDARHFINLSIPPTKGTHIITSVEWGIDLIVVFQLPSDNVTRNDIDRVLKKVYTSLYSNYNTSSMILDEESLLQKILHIKVYSNIPDLCNITTFYDICYYIEQNKMSNVNYPILYNLRPIQWFYPEWNGISHLFIPLSSNLNDNIEQYVFHLTKDIKILETFINNKVPQLLNKHLKEEFIHIEKQWIDIKNKYTNEINRLSKLVINIRSGRFQTLTINQVFKNHEEIIIKNSVRDLTQTLEYLQIKSNFINHLDQQKIQYYNINQLNINQTDNITTIEHKLIINDQYDRILCSNDNLNKMYPIQFNKLCSHLLEQLKNNPNLRIFYADFSYSSLKLYDMMILPLNKYNNDKNITKQKILSTSTKVERCIQPSTSTTKDQIINVLLLGETGVGKSTFINAFVNYFTFKTFAQAQTEIPIVIIPTSFIITVNNNLDKRIVKFGDFIYLNNEEDFNHPGQSTTQHCKSYLFNLNHENGIKLRFIDTPGFGDSRGIDQDNTNIEHILEYVYNLNYLNAICFIFKSNALHIHNYFESCLNQLFSFLYPDIKNNIIFCFTNSRSNFYTSGNTTSIIQNKLYSIPIEDIPFGEENIFCFDNETFRYLVSLQNKIPFTDHEKQDYQMSWSISVTEINRFIHYISTNLIHYQIREDFQSIKHAKFKIIQIIRPILETMRNILRNIILWNMDSPNKSIELRPMIFNHLSRICQLCKSYPYRMGDFWIANISLHHFTNQCHTCNCSINQHIQIDYFIQYQFLNNSSKYHRNQMKDILDQLCYASVRFYHFLINIDHSSKDDPFISAFINMIKEEIYITENFKPNYFNLQLVNDLKQLLKKYEQQKNDIINQQFNTNLSNIYYLINNIQQYPIIRQQLDAAKEGRKINLKQHEYNLSQHLTRKFNK